MHETTIGCGCGCGSGCACDTVPAEFVRVRYYYGQRLGVMELNDQFLYHAGKMAFHDVRLHGYGVLCGLRAERQKPPAGTQSTVLRVTTGAAIDPCGREIAVGIDQCIDVAAWFAKNKSRPAVAAWAAAAAPHVLRVAIRFRECPSDPSPAPRDPCGCDNGGCEFGRVREACELALFTDAETVCAGGATAPDDLVALLEGAGSVGVSGDPATALDRSLDALVAAGCPGCPDGSWLCLASFAVTLDATPITVDIADPDNTIPQRRTLLSTQALQALLLGLAADGASAGLLSAGPHAGAMSFTPDPANKTTAGTLAIAVQLAKSGTPAADVPLVDATFDKTKVAISRIDPTGTAGWTDITSSATVNYDHTAAPQITIAFAKDLDATDLFVLAFEPSPVQPTIDVNGGAVRAFVRRFRFVLDSGGGLALDPSV